MANLAASAVTINQQWTEGGTNGRYLQCRQVTMVLTGQGTTTNTIPASVLRLDSIVSAGPFTASDDTVAYTATSNYDGSLLLLIDATTNAPADITATLRGVVKGFKST